MVYANVNPDHRRVRPIDIEAALAEADALGFGHDPDARARRVAEADVLESLRSIHSRVKEVAYFLRRLEELFNDTVVNEPLKGELNGADWHVLKSIDAFSNTIINAEGLERSKGRLSSEASILREAIGIAGETGQEIVALGKMLAALFAGNMDQSPSARACPLVADIMQTMGARLISMDEEAHLRFDGLFISTARAPS